MFIHKISKQFLKATPKITRTKPIVNCSSSKQIQQHKPTPAQLHARKHNIMEHKFLLNSYKMLQAKQTDSIDHISNNFIRIKRQLNSRHIYVPNKKAYLERLDKAYNKIMQIHQDYNYLEIGKDLNAMTKAQTVQFQLKTIRNAVYLNLLNTYDAAFIFLMLIFIVQVAIQNRQHSQKAQQPMKLTEQIRIFKKIKDFYLSKKLQIFGKPQPFVITPEMQKDLIALNIKRQDSQILKNSIYISQLIQNKLDKK